MRCGSPLSAGKELERALGIAPPSRVCLTAAWSPEGMTAGCSHGRSMLLEPRSRSGTPPRGVNAVAVLPDRRVVVTAGLDGRVLAWQIEAPRLPGEIGNHRGWVNVVAALSDGRMVTGGDDGQVLTWPLEGIRKPVVVGSHHGRIVAVAVLPERRVVTGGFDGRVLAWSAGTPGVAVEIGSHDRGVTAVAVLPERRAGHRRERPACTDVGGVPAQHRGCAA